MSTEKKWIRGKRGMYVKVPTRGARAGKNCYWARVWVKSRQDFAHFYLGLTPKQAQRKLDEILGDPEKALAEREAQRQAARAYTFDQAADLFLANYRSRGGTVYYRDTLKGPRKAFGDRLLTEITSTTLEDYARERRSIQRKKDGARKISESTIRKELIALGTLFKWAKRRGLVQTNPADAESMPRPKETYKEARALTDDELTKVRSAAGPWLDNVIGWATETGMDKGKIMRLRWQEIDLDRARGRIVAGRFSMQREKTGTPIRQALSDRATEVLNRAAKVRHADGIVFLDADAQPIQEKALDWALACAYKAAGITGCNFRTFRHTFATRALRRGVPREVLAKMMGHSTAYITERYMHVADDQLEAAARALSGPERLALGSERDRMADVPGGSAGAPPAVPPADGVEAGVA